MSAARATGIGRWQRTVLVVGLVALALSLAAALFDRRQFFQSYLFVWLFCLGLSLGAMANLMVHHLTGGAWGWLIRRPLEAAVMALPLLALLFVPLLFGLADLYPWARPETVAGSALLQEKAWYLDRPFFLLRAAIYFAVWLALAYRLASLSNVQDRDADPALAGRLRALSAAGLIAYALTVTFAAVDWIMSLTPSWYSTAFGLLIGVGQSLSAFAFAILCAGRLAEREPLRELAAPARFQDLGNLLLMFVMTWAYLAFTQYLIIWAEDLPPEIAWYLPRTQTSWRWVAIFLIVFHFALPFLILLFRAAKRSARAMAALGGAMLAVHWVHVLWLVAPAFRTGGFALHWMDLSATLGIGGLWLAAVLWTLHTRPLLPQAAPGLKEVLQHG